MRLHTTQKIFLLLLLVLVAYTLSQCASGNLFQEEYEPGYATLRKKDEMTMLFVPAGEFMMGIDREGMLYAIEICKQARFQGWSGNWTWRIGCLAKKLGQLGNPVQAISPSGLGQI